LPLVELVETRVRWSSLSRPPAVARSLAVGRACRDPRLLVASLVVGTASRWGRWWRTTGCG